MSHVTFPKPVRGSAILARREKRHALELHEQKEMRKARKRDGNKCRVPRCEYAKRDLPIDVCHVQHRQMGGNPKGDRTHTTILFCACRFHHGLYDAGEFDVEALTKAGADGPLAFYTVTPTQRFLYASETRIGVSETRT